MVYEILDPKAENFKTKELLQLSYLENIKGKKGGFLSNNKPNADKLLKKLEERFIAEFNMPSATFINKHNPSFPAKSNIIDEISESCDFAICAVGD